MKVPEQKPKGAAPAAPSKESGPAPSKQKVFSEKMRKKKAELEPPFPFGAPLHTAPITEPQSPKQDLGGVSGASRVEVPAPIQNLVHEIEVRVEPGGAAEVRIEFDSKVFDGLRVNIRKEDGAIAIRFTTNSESTSQFLANNLAPLSSALASKGIAVAGIQVETSSTSGEGGTFDSDHKGSHSGGSENAGRRQKRR